MEGSLHIGRTANSLGGLRAFDACDYLEFDLQHGPQPKLKALEQVRESGRKGLQFGVKIVCPAAGLPTTEGEQTREAARALGARWIVVGSDRDLRPSAITKAKLREAFKQLSSDAWQIAWQPQGLWEGHQAQHFAAESAVQRVVDPLDPESIIDATSRYFRVSALSVRGALRPTQLAQLADQLGEVPEAYLVLPLRRVDVVARSLRALLASGGGEGLEVALDESELDEAELDEDEETELEAHES